MAARSLLVRKKGRMIGAPAPPSIHASEAHIVRENAKENARLRGVATMKCGGRTHAELGRIIGRARGLESK